MTDNYHLIVILQPAKNFYAAAFFDTDFDSTANYFVILYDIDSRLFVFIK